MRDRGVRLAFVVLIGLLPPMIVAAGGGRGATEGSGAWAEVAGVEVVLAGGFALAWRSRRRLLAGRRVVAAPSRPVVGPASRPIARPASTTPAPTAVPARAVA